MERHVINRKINAILEDVGRLTNVLYAMAAADIQRFPENYRMLALEAAAHCERLTCRQRNLTCETTPTTKPEYLKTAAKLLEIEVSHEDGVTAVELPGLMQGRKKWQGTDFLLDPLYYALQDFTAEHCHPRYIHCVVHFTQVYDRALSSRRIKDFDNLESKQVLDVVAAFLLCDDGGLDCEVHHKSCLGEEDKTLIHVMAADRFPYWKIAQKRGVKVSDVVAFFDGFHPPLLDEE